MDHPPQKYKAIWNVSILSMFILLCSRYFHLPTLVKTSILESKLYPSQLPLRCDHMPSRATASGETRFQSLETVDNKVRLLILFYLLPHTSSKQSVAKAI